MIPTCPRCSAAIILAVSTLGKPLPVDPSPAPCPRSSPATTPPAPPPGKPLPVDPSPAADGTLVLVSSKSRLGVMIALEVHTGERVEGQPRHRAHASSCVNGKRRGKAKVAT